VVAALHVLGFSEEFWGLGGIAYSRLLLFELLMVCGLMRLVLGFVRYVIYPRQSYVWLPKRHSVTVSSNYVPSQRAGEHHCQALLLDSTFTSQTMSTQGLYSATQAPTSIIEVTKCPVRSESGSAMQTRRQESPTQTSERGNGNPSNKTMATRSSRETWTTPQTHTLGLG
jgi:hypothetical protein